MSEYDARVDRAARAIGNRLEARPQAFLTLGSGLGAVAEAIEDPRDVPVSAVPDLATPTVAGHAGVLRIGWLRGRYVIAQVGRVHLYEGHEPGEVTRAVEAAALTGCSTFLVTNAAGGLRPERQQPGDVVLIADHLNLTGASPLTAVLREGAPVFLDMSAAYDPGLRAAARAAAEGHGVDLLEGVYAGLPGPAYETPAEVEMLRRLGADVVGMSTVLEVVAARARGMRVAGFSVVTNVHGAGAPTSHEEVLEVGRRAGAALAEVVVELVGQL